MCLAIPARIEELTTPGNAIVNPGSAQGNLAGAGGRCRSRRICDRACRLRLAETGPRRQSARCNCSPRWGSWMSCARS